MTDQDNSYRPRSPDFSSFASAPSSSFTDAYNPNPYASAAPFTPQASYDASPFFNPHIQQQQQQEQHPQQPQRSEQRPQHQAPQQQQQHQPYNPIRQHFPHLGYPTQPYIPQAYSPVSEMAPQTRSRTQHAQQLQSQQQFQRQPSQEHYPQYHSQELLHEQQLPHHPHHNETQQSYPEPQPQAQQLPEEDAPDEKIPIAPVSSSGPSAGIEVRTKFPVARIKRIMQADEDVGKVAQVTPIAVSKALELFMISLVTKAAQQAKDRSSKRITAAHLKEAIGKDEVLDFLADIISKVPDQSASRKQDDDNSDQNEVPKKKGGRRKKEEPDEDT